MSAAMRAAIADTLNAAAIPNITATPYQPPILLPGSTWPRFHGQDNRMQMFQGMAARVEWEIVTVLPADTGQAAEDAIDAWAYPIAAALNPLGELDRAEPALLTVGDGTTVPVLATALIA